MAKLSRDQIRKLLIDAGFKKNGVDTETMVSIAFAESGGDPNAHNNNRQTRDDSYGLWQINMLGKMGTDRRKQFGITDNKQLFDPATNARAAKKIYDSQGLNAWTTYTRGTYLDYADGTSPEEGGSSNPIADLNPTDNIAGAVNAFGDTLFKTGTNIAGILIAIVLIVLGAVFLLRNALPIGKAAKLVKQVSQ